MVKTFSKHGLCLLPALLSCAFVLPATAQSEGGASVPPPGFLSDVTGPSLDNLGISSQTGVPVGLAPELRGINITTPLPVLVAQADNPTGIALLDSVIEFNHSMDKLVPFCGCSSIKWREYNHTIRVATRLRGTLAASVIEQQKILASNPLPAQISTVQKRLQAIETTTTALENAITILNRLAKALDKAR